MIDWERLAGQAWVVRELAVLAPGGKTKVGCAVVDADGILGFGCNIQHIFRCDIHAEVAALSSLTAAGGRRAVAMLIAAERERFLPCGACMDWVMALGGPECVVGFQAKPFGAILKCRASELMPHYPA